MAEITSVGETAERFEDGLRKESQSASSSVQDDGVKRGPEDTCISSEMEDVAIWVSEFNERLLEEPTRLRVSSTSISRSMHRVPPNIRERNEKAYNPKIISIGPFHCNKRGDELQAMEEHKWRYLRDKKKKEGSLEQYLLAVKELEERARNCYSEFLTLSRCSFAEMLVLDGCFIIELLRKFWEQEENDDPIFKLEWQRCAVATDLLILENQIPFFILERLFVLTYGSSSSSRYGSLVGQIIRFFNSRAWYMGKGYMPKDFNIEIQHLLHLFHTTRTTFPKEKHSEGRFVTIPSASKLKEGGMKFKKSHDSTIMLDIWFQKEQGVIEIPRINVCDDSNFVLLNLIAFEQRYLHCKKYFNTYANVMDKLINTDKDIEILSQNGIIQNSLASDQHAANLFNSMGRDVIVYAEDFYLSDVCDEINRYCERPWSKLRAILVHHYGITRWTIISVFSGLIIFLLTTVTQTFFTAFPKFAYGK